MKRKRFLKYSSEYFQGWYKKENPERLKILEYNLDYLLRRKTDIKSILDVGCSFGEFLALCENRGIRGSGVDISRFAIKKARAITRADIRRIDVSKQHLPFKDKSFDAVVIFDVLEHLHSHRLILNEVFRTLRKRGLIFCTTPNEQGWFGKIAEQIFEEDPTHVNRKNAKRWSDELIQSGFTNIEINSVILHGLPPSPGLRMKLRKIKGFPTFVRPIFFPINTLCGTLYITARKKTS